VPREGLIGASALGGFRQRSYLLPELAKDGDRPSKPLLSQAREELVHGPGRLLHAIPFVLGGREGGIEEQQATTNNVLASESLPMIAEAEVDTPCAAPGPEPLRAVHTSNFPELLQRIDASLLVTTYQAGKLVMVRNEGGRLNAHFRTFQAPMGLALDGDRLAIGTAIQVWEFVNVPAVAARLAPPGRHDACFLPRTSHVTGNIQVHEMAWDADGLLWAVNTRFASRARGRSGISIRAPRSTSRLPRYLD
jgi:hypothetical protein